MGNSGDVTILLGDGTGNFTAAATSPEQTGGSLASLAVVPEHVVHPEQVLAELHGISAEMRAGFNRIRRRWPAAVPVQIAAKDVRERDSRLLT